MDSVIARRPDIIDPLRRDWQKQQVFVSGLDMLANCNKKKNAIKYLKCESKQKYKLVL